MTPARKRTARITLDLTTVVLVIAGFVIASGGHLPQIRHEAPVVHEQPGVLIVGTPAPDPGIHI